VIGDPLPGNSRQFTDLYVSPGEKYWYRLVAVDKNGNRSDPTRPVALRVGSPQIPAPTAPIAKYASTPYPHVVVQFQPPPSGLSLIVERQIQSSLIQAGEDQTGKSQPGTDPTKNGWIRIAGPMTGQTITDNTLPQSASAAYRIAYATAEGTVGPASPAVTVANPDK
jgi:hypothetical protein